ncbi:MAG: hypothetical protein V4584_17130 [Verrucomicrobiota bacterium]
MHAKSLIPILLVCLAARSPALSPEGKKTGEELVTNLKEEMKALAGDDQNQNEIAAIRQYLRQVQNALGQESDRQIPSLLENYGNYEPTEKVTGCVEALTRSIKDDVERKTQTIIDELEGTLAAAAQSVARADAPADLDKMILSLSRNRFNNDNGDSYNSSDPTLRALMSELGTARQFVTTWQDYLQASNSGNRAQAVQALRNLSNQEKTLVPRSQIIARIEFEQADEDEVAKLLAQVGKLDDMKEAIRKLTRLSAGNRSSGTENPAPREALQTLIRLEKAYREHLAGLPVNVEVIQSSAESGERGALVDFTTLRASLLLLVLPRALDLPDGFLPAEGESVAGFLARAMEDARHREDIAGGLRIAAIRQTLVRSANFSDKEMEALRDYAAGASQLAASQHLMAVVSLQKALKSGSDLIPAARAGEMLETIRKDHPAEYEQGMMEFLTPRPTPEFDYSRMPFRPPYMPGMRFPDGDPRNPGGTTIVLPVPGKDGSKETPKPAATPTEGGKPPEPGKPSPQAPPPP